MGVLNRDKFPLRRGSHARTTPGAIARRSLAARILAMREDYMTYEQIVAALARDGSATITATRCQQLADQELKDRVKVDVEVMRARHLARMDRLYNRAEQIGLSPRPDAVAALGQAIRVLEREAALVGLDAPKQTEVKDTTQYDPTPATIEDFVAQLAEEARADAARAGGADAAQPAGGARDPG